jgi:hypothetical protein
MDGAARNFKKCIWTSFSLDQDNLTKFRPGQFDAIEALVSRKDTIVVVMWPQLAAKTKASV